MGAFIPLVAWVFTRASNIAFYITIALSVCWIVILGAVTGYLYRFPREKLALVIFRQFGLVAAACAVVIGINNGISRFVVSAR